MNLLNQNWAIAAFAAAFSSILFARRQTKQLIFITFRLHVESNPPSLSTELYQRANLYLPGRSL